MNLAGVKIVMARLKSEQLDNSLFKLDRVHQKKIFENLSEFFEDVSWIEKFDLPVFHEEIEVKRKRVYEKFNFLNESDSLSDSTEGFKSIILSDYLVVLGMRITSASVRNVDGIPPLNDEVFKASFDPYNSQVSKAVRAFEKHSERFQDCFWGKSKGQPAQKEEFVKGIVNNILENHTWWNIFGHYQHGLVYEVRLPSGHGARWRKDNLEFIGFVEPFDKIENK